NRMQAIFFDALADQILLDSCCTALGELLVVSRGTDAVGMTRDQDQLDLRMSLHLFHDFGVKTGLALFSQRVLVETEQHFGLQCHFLKGRLFGTLQWWQRCRLGCRLD